MKRSNILINEEIIYKMNLIQRHATDFYQFLKGSTLDSIGVIERVRIKLYDYHKSIVKLEYISHLIRFYKKDYDEHLVVCENKKTCYEIHYYEDILFFLQQEVDRINEELDPQYFKVQEKESITEELVKIQDELFRVRTAQDFSYVEVMEALEEMKEYFYLNKPSWKQLLLGKLSEMLVGGIIEEATAKPIMDYRV